MDEQAKDKANESSENKSDEFSAKSPDSGAEVERSKTEDAKAEDATSSDEKSTVAEAPAKQTETQGKAKTRKRDLADLSIFDLAVGVFLLVILSQLLANSYVAWLGKSYNERVCKESIALAGKAANEGYDTPHVQLAAFGSWEHCATPGFFIEHPEFILFTDEIDPEAKLRVITICSSTRVRVPMPCLVMDKSAIISDANASAADLLFPQIVFKKTYQYKLTNPKGIANKLIKDSSGNVISKPVAPAPPAKGGAPAAKTGAPGTAVKGADKTAPQSEAGKQAAPRPNP